MSTENRLNLEQLAALQPGDTVTVESARAFDRTRQTAGTVVRVSGSRIVVSVRSRYGATYAEEYGLRDGLRVGDRDRAELITSDSAEPAQRRRTPTPARHRRRLPALDPHPRRPRPAPGSTRRYRRRPAGRASNGPPS